MIGKQKALPHMKRRSFSRQSCFRKGQTGEIIVAQALEDRGYKVAIAHECGDLTVTLPDGEILYIEVKIAGRGKDGKWRFTLWKQGSQDHRATDFVVLLCKCKSGDIPFVIPTGAVRDKSHAVITSFPQSYSGKLAQYRQTLRGIALTVSNKE